MQAAPLTREQAIERLVASAPEIRVLGVRRLALFGSVARLGRTVELVTVEALSPFLGPHILAEAENVLGAA